MKSRLSDSDASATRQVDLELLLGSRCSRFCPEAPTNADRIGKRTLQMDNFVPLRWS
jgi:hypothetical protein